jgi:hypothetical protein
MPLLMQVVPGIHGGTPAPEPAGAASTLHLMAAPGVGTGGDGPPAPDPTVLLWAVVVASVDPASTAARVAGSPWWRT